MVSSVTDLPEPFGPKMTKISPPESAKSELFQAEGAERERERLDGDAGDHRLSRSGAPRCASVRKSTNKASETMSSSTAAPAAWSSPKRRNSS